MRAVWLGVQDWQRAAAAGGVACAGSACVRPALRCCVLRWVLPGPSSIYLPPPFLQQHRRQIVCCTGHWLLKSCKYCQHHPHADAASQASCLDDCTTRLRQLHAYVTPPQPQWLTTFGHAVHQSTHLQISALLLPPQSPSSNTWACPRLQAAATHHAAH